MLYRPVGYFGLRSSWAFVRHLTSDGYLHKTDIPTFKFQKSLPKLPLPKLEETLDRYLASASAVVAPEKLENTRMLAAEFKNGPGPKLQSELENLNKTKWKDSSFISEFWFDTYLEDRRPLPLNYNPQLTFKNHTNAEMMDQVTRASSLIHSSVAFFRTLRDRQLEPDMFHTKPAKSETELFRTLVKIVPERAAWFVGLAFGAYALDMSQYGRLFHSTRIPEASKDRLESFPESRHIVVQRGNQFFIVGVLNEDGSSVSREQIQADLQAIINYKERGDAPPVGLLTTMNRDDWAEARRVLTKEEQNAKSLREVDSALFAVCLENMRLSDLVVEAKCMLHGNGRNRWFDKSFQLIVNEDGRSAVNFEHAWGDGVAVLRYFNEIYKESASHVPLSPSSIPTPSHELSPLEWSLDASMLKKIEAAGDAMDALYCSTELIVEETDVIAPSFLKSKNLGVDGTLQMAFQLAHFKMYGFAAATYESASTAGFKHGRTETIRSATVDSNKFCTVMCNGESSVDEKAAALRKAVKNHGTITKDALLGKGFDRHLFALRTLAEKAGLSEPLFDDETYKVMSKIILSTSTLSSPALDGGGFGPVNDECYGIMYGTTDDKARFGVTSYFRNTPEFAKCLVDACKEIREVLDKESAQQ